MPRRATSTECSALLTSTSLHGVHGYPRGASSTEYLSFFNWGPPIPMQCTRPSTSFVDLYTYNTQTHHTDCTHHEVSTPIAHHTQTHHTECTHHEVSTQHTTHKHTTQSAHTMRLAHLQHTAHKHNTQSAHTMRLACRFDRRRPMHCWAQSFIGCVLKNGF